MEVLVLVMLLDDVRQRVLRGHSDLINQLCLWATTPIFMHRTRNRVRENLTRRWKGLNQIEVLARLLDQSEQQRNVECNGNLLSITPALQLFAVHYPNTLGYMWLDPCLDRTPSVLPIYVLLTQPPKPEITFHQHSCIYHLHAIVKDDGHLIIYNSTCHAWMTTFEDECRLVDTVTVMNQLEGCSVSVYKRKSLEYRATRTAPT